jgi:acetylornithine/succinyldiaminopimelate/putrescine aminotransferase
VHRITIAKADNDLLVDESGKRYIDMFTANGTTWLGHGNRRVAAAIARQLNEVWITGALPTHVRREATETLERLFPATHRVAGLYSTGMEAAEFALRAARAITGRGGALGFEHGMHGKSLATSSLGWEDDGRPTIPGYARLPFLPRASEGEILGEVASHLMRRSVSAVFVEPVQLTGGGYTASGDFYRELARLCRATGTLLVFDELLTGLYRTGEAFFFHGVGVTPDCVLVGKSLGNGFPVSAVVLGKEHPLSQKMLPGSTYAGNALAAAAVLATLRVMQTMDLPQAVDEIARVIGTAFAGLRGPHLKLRGKGALWVLEVSADIDLPAVIENVYRRGVCVGYADRYLRLLPAATIETDHLATACSVIAEELAAAPGIDEPVRAVTDDGPGAGP